MNLALHFANRRVRVLVVSFVVCTCVSAYSAFVVDNHGIELRGHCIVKYYNPSTGKLYSESTETNLFCVTLGQDTYYLSVTNVAWDKLWTELIYDGTNNYYYYITTTVRENRAIVAQKKVYVEVNRKPHALLGYKALDIEFPWLMYCLRWALLPTGQTQLVYQPFVGVRYNPELMYGWKWEVTWSPCNNFPALIRQVRDTSLELSLREEMAREEINCPETVDEWNYFTMHLAGRRWASNEHVHLEYKCINWFCTNGVNIPLEGLFKINDFPRAPNVTYKWPLRIIEVRAHSISLVPNVSPSIPRISTPVRVFDYRYRRAGNDRIFPYATYTLKPGEPFRSANDPKLLAQAEQHLRRGRKYYEPPVSRRHKLLWGVAVVLAIPPLLYLWYRWRKAE